VTLLVYDDECYICLQHLQRLCPQEWLLPIVVLGLDISARTNRFLILFGCLKATMGGAGKMLYYLEFFRRMPNAHKWCWSCFLDSDGMWEHNGFFYISVCLCTEINSPWNCYELCLNFSSQYFVYSPFFKWFLCWLDRFFKDLSSEQIRLNLRAWLYDMFLVTWGGWHLLDKRYWLVSVGSRYKSVDCSPSDKELEVSRREMIAFYISWVNLIEGWRLLVRERKLCNSSSLSPLHIHIFYKFVPRKRSFDRRFEQFFLKCSHLCISIRWSHFGDDSCAICL
jgi:hypothetical protein